MKKHLIGGLAAIAMLGSAALAQTTVIELEPEQRTTVYQSIIPSAPPSPQVQFSVEVGATIPEEVELHVVPETVEVEPVHGLRYVVVNEQLVLVDPNNRTIVAVVEE